MIGETGPRESDGQVKKALPAKRIYKKYGEPDDQIDNQIKEMLPAEKTYKKYIGRDFYIEVRPNGGKSFMFRYTFDGKERRISFGVYPKVGLKEALHKRELALYHLKEGRDPSRIQAAKKKRLISSRKEIINIDKILKYVPESAKEDMKRFVEVLMYYRNN